MNHDRIHAREPQQDPERWTSGRIDSIREEDGHCVVTVRPEDGDQRVELTVTFAVRDLFVERLPIDGDQSPVGERIWYRERGG
ncbi:hypothetical protein GRX03_00160 [Halovenus sp. WSH3]|uniref:Uncharacterized protein n=1 Tax=Halovenus carboxidivorans TaxID=2692199 RepID=A0A6B0T3H6_9EURY|nr:hypothetical protein [Halovenus carboxidivorans]MXR50023.1 hypothetical protein [Halovenus carboxidivorans]